jgi:hypothetical protein
MQELIDKTVVSIKNNPIAYHFISKELENSSSCLSTYQLEMLVKMLQSVEKEEELSEKEALFRIFCYAHHVNQNKLTLTKSENKNDELTLSSVDENENENALALENLTTSPEVEDPEIALSKHKGELMRISSLIEKTGFEFFPSVKTHKIFTIVGYILVRYLSEKDIKSHCHNKKTQRYSHSYRVTDESLAATQYILKKIFSDRGKFVKKPTFYKSLNISRLEGLIEMFR